MRIIFTGSSVLDIMDGVADKFGWVVGVVLRPDECPGKLQVFPTRDSQKATKYIKPGARGELEITSVNPEFLKDGELKVQVFGKGFAGLDTSIHDSLAEPSICVDVIEKHQVLKISCLEGIVFRKGCISEEKNLLNLCSRTNMTNTS